MSIFKKVSLLAALGVTQMGCVATPAKSMQAAVLDKPTPATTRMLNQTVSRALNGTKVSLASRAFTQRSQEQIERATHNPVGMEGLNGRLMEAPEVYHFSMKKQGDACYLVYDKTGKAYLLEGVACRALQ